MFVRLYMHVTVSQVILFGLALLFLAVGQGMSGTGKAKSVRYKVQCLLCSEVFDNDYIKRHTRVQHKDYFSQNRTAPTCPFSDTETSAARGLMVF